jgi:plastocyanin
MRSAIFHVLLVCSVVISACFAFAQNRNVTARVITETEAGHNKAHDIENAVLWLTSLDGPTPAPILPEKHPRLTQRNKSFEPHLLVIPVGSIVEFPNRDPFFHNVFSLFEGKRFDLGLYEAGTTREVHFDKPGISYIFCNIHAQMSAVVVALDTPYFGISNRRGEVVIPNVPAGHYTLQVWSEAALPESLKALSRKVFVTDQQSTLGVLRIKTTQVMMAHKNKYGRDYDPPTPDTPVYDQQ